MRPVQGSRLMGIVENAYIYRSGTWGSVRVSMTMKVDEIDRER